MWPCGSSVQWRLGSPPALRQSSGSDERYKVEPIPIAEKDALVKAQSDLVALQKAYRNLEAKQNSSLVSSRSQSAGQPIRAACINERSELESLKQSYAKSQADLTAALGSCAKEPAVSATGYRPTELSKISITLNYATKRLADANMISSRLGPEFKELQLSICTMACNRSAQIIYGYDLTAPIAFSVAKLLTQAGIAEFAQPMISRGEGPRRMTIYLSD